MQAIMKLLNKSLLVNLFTIWVWDNELLEKLGLSTGNHHLFTLPENVNKNAETRFFARFSWNFRLKFAIFKTWSPRNQGSPWSREPRASVSQQNQGRPHVKIQTFSRSKVSRFKSNRTKLSKVFQRPPRHHNETALLFFKSRIKMAETKGEQVRVVCYC